MPAPQTPETLGSRFDPARNNFDAIRLGAALIVLLSHSYSLSGAAWEPVSSWLGYGYGGTLAVDVFFVLSGFLVARSVESRDTGAFVAGRLLRILPGLAFVTLIEAAVIAPLFYEGPTAEYFRHFALPHMANVFVFGEDPAIVGVFTKLPFPYVNGSLWTLPVECVFYILLPILALAARGRRSVILAAFVVSLVAEPFARWHGLNDEAFGGFLFRTVRLFSVSELSCYFLAGVAAWAYRDRIPWSRGAAALFLLLLFASRGRLAGPLALKLALPYLVLFCSLHGGTGTWLKRRVGDLSYGVYLFSYPLTNAVIALGGMKFSPEVVAGLAGLGSLGAAAISWNLVEAPALRFKRRGEATAAPRRWPMALPRLLAPPGTPNGNFTALRIFAVGLVVYGNGLLLTGATPTAYWGAPTARLGLDLLFCIGGYLALDAWRRRPRPLAFASRRAVRLLPALAICVVLTVAVIGALATTLPLRHYVLNGMSREYLANIALVQRLWLPGVFQGQQWSGAVNPMLWTLAAAVMLWAAIAGIGLLPARARTPALAVAATASMIAALLLDPAPAGQPLRARITEIMVETPFFLIAALFRQVEGRIAHLWRADLAVLLFAANWISATWLGAGNLPLEWLTLPYMAACFGRMSAPLLGRLGALGNPSYGFYLYAFPVQQLIVARWPGLAFPLLTSAGAALAAGYLSWHLVERPALAWAERGAPLPWKLRRVGVP